MRKLAQRGTWACRRTYSSRTEPGGSPEAQLRGCGIPCGCQRGRGNEAGGFTVWWNLCLPISKMGGWFPPGRVVKAE